MGIRDIERHEVNVGVYNRVRSTLPADPRTPSVDDIIEAMCKRLAEALEYDYDAPKYGCRPNYPRDKKRRPRPRTEAARRLVLENPGLRNIDISRKYDIPAQTISRARVELLQSGDLKR
jgi:hypothetical protein